MGVLNITPDSFSDGGRLFDGEAVRLDAVRDEVVSAFLYFVGLFVRYDVLCVEGVWSYYFTFRFVLCFLRSCVKVSHCVCWSLFLVFFLFFF